MPWTRILGCGALAAAIPAAVLAAEAGSVAVPRGEGRYQQLVQRHFDRVLATGLDRYGKDKNSLWLASIDLANGGQNEKVDNASRRVYRRIHAPRGSNLYWDLPTLVAAYQLSEKTGDPKYAAACDAYINDFFARCVSQENGLFLWGNHLWYHVFDDRMEKIGHPAHEARPLPINWEAFWRNSPERTARCIRAFGTHHVTDQTTGSFDRHAKTTVAVYRPTEKDVAASYPFLEAGGVIAESLCWLAAKDVEDKDALIETALKVARYSAAQRGEATGLIRNQPVQRRWDYKSASSEVGLWGAMLLRCGELSGNAEFAEIPQPGMLAYLRYGWDAEAGKYFGSVNVEDGQPSKPNTSEPFAPTRHSDVWEPLFPTHDYPMEMAEACLDFYEKTGRGEYRAGAERWAEHVRNSLPAQYQQERHSGPMIDGAFASSYGRAIHFLSRAGRILNQPEYRQLAEQVAEEAVGRLYIADIGAFRSHPGEDVADAVDGLGVLFLALMELESGDDGELQGFHF
ncbi:MAG: hypothetical protein KF688_11050 [Pirellulales bacterium]|nr:hypothetical protein [Pirellulales bacterium]